MFAITGQGNWAFFFNVVGNRTPQHQGAQRSLDLPIVLPVLGQLLDARKTLFPDPDLPLLPGLRVRVGENRLGLVVRNRPVFLDVSRPRPPDAAQQEVTHRRQLGEGHVDFPVQIAHFVAFHMQFIKYEPDYMAKKRRSKAFLVFFSDLPVTKSNHTQWETDDRQDLNLRLPSHDTRCGCLA